MKKIWPFLLLLLPVLLVLSLPRLIGGDAGGPILTVHCPDLVQGCQVEFGARRAEVRFLSAPTPLKRFDLVVKAPDAGQVTADFAMQGMNMGPNHYVLQRIADGVWQGNILLPVCVSGVSNWTMMLELDGVKRQIPFVAVKQ
ncbi:MAG: hypothetical protein KJ958_06160 [Gammaproteobacteria bacterium]|nr:hypothetical protein [Gammaproteobacteria bacterium]MBU1978738.1 hypothetical protein [Gammaproteobacteria bacterium]